MCAFGCEASVAGGHLIGSRHVCTTPVNAVTGLQEQSLRCVSPAVPSPRAKRAVEYEYYQRGCASAIIE